MSPGQFIEIRCSDDLNPLLRRPLGLHRILKNGIEVLYEVVGKGTALLSKKRKGESLDIIGPLGNGFDIKAGMGQATIIIAGGIGVAPLVSLAEEIARSPRPALHGRELYVLIGACKRSHILCEKDFKKLGAKVLIATEDGSKGYKGLATDLLKDFLNPKPYILYPAIYACGPNEMLKTVAWIAKDRRIPCQISLEERMACGVGACLGCAVKVKGGGYKMVCKDGPIFNAEEIAW
ncbi:MAG: dihydroorotate dehydrogenase electron transfer subunit [Candidatus Omnitrophica bacterium]|nr:dihydroorotate dehydrogenase electron transfer subunit [Candidatus Omnitrophota bacterium]